MSADFALDDDLLLTTHAFKALSHEEKHKALKRLRDEAPISFHPEGKTSWTPNGGPGYWAIVRYDDVRLLSRKHEIFSSHAGTLMQDMPEEQIRAASILHMDNPEHRQVRGIVSRAFTRDAMSKMEDSIRQNADRIIDKFLEDDVSDITKDLVHIYPGRVLAEVLGLPAEDVDMFVKAVNDLFSIDLSANQKAAEFLIGYSIQKSVERRQSPGDDMISVIIEGEVEGRKMNDFEVGTFINILIVGGSETTGSTLATALWQLAKNPDQWDALKKDPSLINGAMNEALRYTTATACFKRTALEDFELHGTTIKKGDKIVMYHESANFDERYFPDPLKFDIFRDASKQVAFGAGGPHTCIGVHLARLEMSVFFEQLLKRVDHMVVVEDMINPENQQFNACANLKLSFAPAV